MEFLRIKKLKLGLARALGAGGVCMILSSPVLAYTQSTSTIPITGGVGGIKVELSQINASINKVNTSVNATKGEVSKITDLSDKSLLYSNTLDSLSNLGQYQTNFLAGNNLEQEYENNFNNWLNEQQCLSSVSFDQYNQYASSLSVSGRSYQGSSVCKPYIQELYNNVDKAFFSIMENVSSANLPPSYISNLKEKAFTSLKDSMISGDANSTEDSSNESLNVLSQLNAAKDSTSNSSNKEPALSKFSSSMIKSAKGNKRLTNELSSKLSVINTLVATVNKVQSSNNDKDRDNQQQIIKGLLAAQLNNGYLNKVKSANTVQLTRLLVINGIVNNYLQNQKLQALRNIESQNNASLLDQAAVLSTQIQHNK